MDSFNPEEDYQRFKDPKYCFIPSCKNNSVKNAEKRFFCVPNSTKEEWCKAVGARCPKRVLYVCEDHLNLEEDMENYDHWVKSVNVRTKLKPRVPRSLIHTHLQQPPQCSTSTLSLQSENTVAGNPSNKAVQVKPTTADRSISCSIPIRKKTAMMDTDDMFVAEDIAEEEIPSTQGSSFSACTSEVSSEMQPKIDFCGKEFMLGLIEKKPFSYIGVPKKFFWLISFISKELKISDLYITITLYKIKNNIPFYQICDMFQVSRTTIWRFFFSSLNALSKFFNQLIFCPVVNVIKRNLPPCFRTNKVYYNVYCIIDCFEIEIEKPSNPLQQSLTWSQYKSTNTLKYLVATTPDGFINFISKGFGGRISDTNIVEQSGFLEAIPSNCTILADRGFKHIESTLNKKQVNLLRPPSVSKNTKLTKQEAINSKVIASLRIHVERVIRRIRQFKFLKPHSVINNKIVQHTDEVVIVSCGLINLQSPIIRKE